MEKPFQLELQPGDIYIDDLAVEVRIFEKPKVRFAADLQSKILTCTNLNLDEGATGRHK